jgi:chaperone modulatory protein CbpM
MTSFDECLPGEIFEEGAVLSVADLARMFAVEERHIVALAEEGVITALEIESTEWRFSGADIRRARIALRLERDLGINLPGVALSLELLEELEPLRRERRGRP